MICVIRSNIRSTLKFQIVLMKQPDPAPQNRMQVGNISRKNSYFPHFAPQKQISCIRNEPNVCISISTWQTTEVSTLT